jgi:glycosyltransferase involved in cell wall biosynthesis
MPSTVAIDYTSALAQGGGIGRYTRELVRALAAQDVRTDYRLFVALRRRDALPDTPGVNFTWAAARLDPAWFARLWHRLRVPLRIERWTGPVDLLHAPDFTLPPVEPDTRTLLTVHDLSFVRAPEAAAPGLRAYLNRVVPRSVRRADHILVDSDATRRDLIDLYGTPGEKVSVVYSGVDARFGPVEDAGAIRAVRAKYGIGDGPFILSVGTVQPRKNYARLAEALHRLDRPDLPLVIAGGKGWLEDDLYARIDALGLGGRVRFIGFVDDDDLPALYSTARVFAFPSLYEGFGLPPLEAMACGTPVVASNVSSVPEVVGEAGLLVDPLDVDALAGALARALDDEGLRASLIEQGRERAGEFTWDQTASAVRRQYDALLNG